MATETFETMGTVVSIAFPATPPTPDVMEQVRGSFSSLDQRFSLYRPLSEISRVARGELTVPQTGPAFRDAYAQALHWRSLTHGAFTPHRPDGVIDLSGLVKAHAIDAAGRVLLRAGVPDWMINAGGDILAHGSAKGQAWRVGIVDPSNRLALLAAVELTGPWSAIATSGTSERGDHIWRLPHATGFSQVSVLARDIVSADVLATAILAGGVETLNHATDSWDIDAVCTDAAGSLTMTGRVRRRLTDPDHQGRGWVPSTNRPTSAHRFPRRDEFGGP